MSQYPNVPTTERVILTSPFVMRQTTNVTLVNINGNELTNKPKTHGTYGMTLDSVKNGVIMVITYV